MSTPESVLSEQDPSYRLGGEPFARVSKKAYGYSPGKVEKFLMRARESYSSSSPGPDTLTSREVRETTFEAVRGGYDPHAVDAALDRLEDVFVQRERDAFIAQRGEDVWLAHLGRVSALLRSRLHRPDGDRFRRPHRKNVQGYAIAEVDRLCHELLEYLERDRPMSADTVRRAVFNPAKGIQSYEEHQVDAFLDRMIGLMASID